MGSGASKPVEESLDGEVSGKRATPAKHWTYPKQKQWKQTVIQQSKSNALLVAAVDFGTTYSGYAYSFNTKPDNILATYWNRVSIKVNKSNIERTHSVNGI
ncbi:uncharacterized protein LOC132743844 [Ruditapes philippinarum]|uniref:uncharacterized protein LOC132743844 n=1 Tax=Ruditapes philippinarum TaxID=129788 RepID=UPI00295BF324|nr:uncharacterized protein LOC132743844 [Ruditapes philippinarum]